MHASEALPGRFRKDGYLRSIHPPVDLRNAGSLACAIPIPGLYLDRVTGNLTVRHANGRRPPTSAVPGGSETGGEIDGRVLCYTKLSHPRGSP